MSDSIINVSNNKMAHAGIVTYLFDGRDVRFLIGEESVYLIEKDKVFPSNLQDALKKLWEKTDQKLLYEKELPASSGQIVLSLQRFPMGLPYNQQTDERTRRCKELSLILGTDVRGSGIIASPRESYNSFRFFVNGGRKSPMKGNQETKDNKNLINTALREWREEIGFATDSITESKLATAQNASIKGANGDPYKFWFVKIESSEANQIRSAYQQQIEKQKQSELFNLNFLTLSQIAVSPRNIIMDNLFPTLKSIEASFGSIESPPSRPPSPAYIPPHRRGGKRKTYRKKKAHRKTSKAKRK